MMTCTKCRRMFTEGDHVQYTGIAVYHEVPKPGADAFQYAVSRPYCVSNIEHLVCEE